MSLAHIFRMPNIPPHFNDIAIRIISVRWKSTTVIAEICEEMQFLLTFTDKRLVSEWTFSCASTNSRRSFLNSCACFSSAEL